MCACVGISPGKETWKRKIKIGGNPFVDPFKSIRKYLSFLPFLQKKSNKEKTENEKKEYKNRFDQRIYITSNREGKGEKEITKK